ncbi:MAG: hypothetical protein IKR27_09765 [Lachnospiraceae bacterium]|nr:hypothetical protein [Lachnospiraceae bacterium]
MSKTRKIIIAIIVIMSLISCIAFATGSSDPWSIRYIPNAPASVSNQNDYTQNDYTSGFYKATANTWTGVNGATIEITCPSFPINNISHKILITTSGDSASWTISGNNHYSGEVITHKLEAVTGYTVTSNGTVHFAS